MPRLQTTVGQMLVNDALPEDMRDYNRTLDKKALTALLSDVATKHPDRYREISHALSNIGRRVSYSTGGFSFGLKHLRPSTVALQARRQLQAELAAIGDNDSLDDAAREKKILIAVSRASEGLSKKVYDEALAAGNPLAKQVLSGARGNPMNLSSLISQDFLYTDHRGKVMPLPVLRSYSEGLSPAEYWAGMYGARKGTMDTKFATQDAGFLSKQLNQISHRAVVVDLDGDGEPDTLRGYPVDTDDPDNEGALLSNPAGGYPRNTVLTPKILSDLRQRKVPRILVRSPMVGGTPDGGVYARDVGMREFGRLPTTGENVGLTAAQALSEPLSQAQLSSKHSGGVAGSSANQATGGFQLINQLIQTPKTFKGGAAHSTMDGTVEHVSDAPAGGKYVQIGGQQHYVGTGFELRVKQGDKIEAGDVISEGVPDPSLIVQYKGVGEGRRYFVNAFRQAFRDAGIKGHRRNIELLAKGLINHVRLTDEVGDYAPDDIVPYSVLEHSYKPREGGRVLSPSAAVNQYLEKPYLHYSIGTRIRPSMMRDFNDFGVKEVAVHSDPPPFEPEMIRGMANMQHDPDWITRMLGSGQKSSLLDSVHRGGYSDEAGTSFVPGLAKTVNFGQIGKVQTPKPNANDDQARAMKTFKVGEDQLTSQARELMEQIKQADKPGDRHRDKRTEQNRGTRIARPFTEDITARGVYDESVHSALPDAHGYKPKPAIAWKDLPTEQQQQYQRAIRHAMQQLNQYEQGLDRSPEYGGTGSFTNDVIIPAGLSWPFSHNPRLNQLGPASTSYAVPVPDEASRSQFHLPNYGDEITDWTSSDLNPAAWNPQRFVQRYNQAVSASGPMSAETLVRAVEGVRQAYPEAFAESAKGLQMPATPPPPAAPQAPTLAQPKPPMPAAPSQDVLDQQNIDQIQAAPKWNDGPGYTPGYGLLPLAQMADRAMPGTTNKLLQMSGGVGIPLLADVNAVGQFTRGPQAVQPAAPPPTPPPPAPAAPPRVPQQPPAPAAPKPPAPRPNQPQQPAPPRQPKPMTPPKSNIPQPASPVPGG